MLVRAVIAAAAAAFGVLPAPGSAAPAPRMQVWEIVRTSSAPSKLAVAMSVGYHDSRAMLALTYLRHTRSGLKALPGAHVSSREGATEPEGYAGGNRLSCSRVSGVQCTTVEGRTLLTAYYNDEGLRDPLAPDTIIAVTYGYDGAVGVGGGPWKVRKVNRAARALWSTDGDDAAGVWSPAFGAEAFTTASLKGGSRGSVAIGVPPCSGVPIGVSGGAGSVTLSGGVAPVQASCPADVLRPSQVARRATTWTLNGPVAGLTAEVVSEPGTVRLVVIDF